MTITALPTVRQSALARLELCPLSARLGELKARHTTHAMARGTAYHAFVAEVVATCMERSETRMEPAEGREVMQRIVGESVEPIPQAEHDSLLAMAWRFCREAVFDLDHIVDLEEGYALETGGFRVTGKPDWVEIDGDVATIRDHKTSFAMESERAHSLDTPGEVDDLDTDAVRGGPFQLRLYALLVAEAWPHVRTFRLILDYPRWGEEREWVLDRSDLWKVSEHLDTLLERLRVARETEVYAACPGSWCATCPQPLDCTIPARDRGEGAITSVESAQAAADYVVAAEAAVKQAKGGLKAWCADNGPAFAGDQEFAFREKAVSKKVIDLERLEADMRAAGLDPDLYFVASKTSTEFRARRVKVA